MKVVDRIGVSKDPQGPRKFTFEFTTPGLLSVIVVVLLGFVWVFILGVLVGRGYKPENAVPELAQMMPAPAPASQPEQTEPPKPLKPEELQFQDVLQGKKPADSMGTDQAQKPQDKPSDDKTAGSAPQISALEKTPAPLPKGRVATAPAQPDKKALAMTSAQPDKKPAGPEAKSKDKAEAGVKFLAVYQLGSHTDLKEAKTEADHLAKKGLKTSVQEAKADGKTVFRVMAHVKGSEAEIKAALEKSGVKSPILREKKPL
jgi:energy-converting hydrogenase Eha subunit F